MGCPNTLTETDLSLARDGSAERPKRYRLETEIADRLGPPSPGGSSLPRAHHGHWVPELRAF